MESCITPYPDIPVEKLEPFPQRLNALPPKIASGSVPGVFAKTFEEDKKKWEKHVNAYKKIDRLMNSGRYRNIVNINAGFGSFAAALESPKLWVMNVVPMIAEKSTLGVIYERGLIGIYHDWYRQFISNAQLRSISGLDYIIIAVVMMFFLVIAFSSLYLNHFLFLVAGNLFRSEAFSTYPRTYDLIHAHGVFSLDHRIFWSRKDLVD